MKSEKTSKLRLQSFRKCVEFLLEKLKHHITQNKSPFLLYLTLGLVLALALYIRIWGLNSTGSESYFIYSYTNEIYNGQNPYLRILNSDMIVNRKYPTFPPLYFYLGLIPLYLGYSSYPSWTLFMKVFFLIPADFGITILIIIILKNQTKITPWFGVFSVCVWLFNRWNLYIIKNALIDSFTIFFILLSLYFFYSRPNLSYFLLGVAIAMKLFPIFLLPLYLIMHRKEDVSAMLTYLFLALISIFLVSLPYVVWNVEAYYRSLLFSATSGEEYYMLNKLLPGLGTYVFQLQLLMLVAYSLFYYLHWKKQFDIYVFSTIGLLISLLMSPVMFPQYWVWFIPFTLIAIGKQFGSLSKRSGETYAQTERPLSDMKLNNIRDVQNPQVGRKSLELLFDTLRDYLKLLKKSPYLYIALGLILALALYIRIYGLPFYKTVSDSLMLYRYTNEIYNGQNPYLRILNSDMIVNRKYPTFPPLYFYLGLIPLYLGYSSYPSWTFFMKVFFLIPADFGITILIIVILKNQTKMTPWFGVFSVYVWLFNKWNLYIIKNALIDSFTIFFILLSLYFFYSRPNLSYFLLGVAIAMKLFPIFLLPLYLIMHRKEDVSTMLMYLFLALISIFLVSLPYVIWNVEAYYRSLLFSATRGETHIGSELLPGLGTYGFQLRLPMLVAFSLFYYSHWKKQFDIYVFSTVGLLIWLLMTPVIFPQYWVWFIPFALIAVGKHFGSNSPINT